jgi:RNA polymerase sigma factor (sigma-70 family)
MARNQLNIVFSHIRHLVGARQCGDSTDNDLLQRFAAQREEAAFAALMHRHGPMVLRVCRRVANNLEDAEEAFQATFLVLVRKANSIRRGEAVGSWLCSVAYRVAREARIRADQQRTRERQAMIPTPSDPSMEAAKQELHRILDEVLDQLPAKYRSPLVLHYLEARPRKRRRDSSAGPREPSRVGWRGRGTCSATA